MFLNDSEGCIDYNGLVEQAMRSVIREAIKEIRDNKDDKRYCLMFEINTKHKGVKLPKNILLQYPKTITLIIQYQFSNLEVFDNYFCVDLSFNGKICNVTIPFDSILSFLDKENEFEIKFNNNGGGDEFLVSYEEEDCTSYNNESYDVLSDNLVSFNDLKK